MWNEIKISNVNLRKQSIKNYLESTLHQVFSSMFWTFKVAYTGILRDKTLENKLMHIPMSRLN